MKYTLFLFIIVCSITFTGCTLFSLSKQQSEFAQPQQQQATPKTALVEIRFITDTPVLADSPSYHKGYGGAVASNLFRTATHLITGAYDRLVITNQSGGICPLQNVWSHPYADIALVKTTNDCFPIVFTPYGPLSAPLHQVVYIVDGVAKKTTYTAISDHDILLDEILLPGMSGSPVRGANNMIIGIISAQQASGTMAILLTEKLLSYRQDVLSEGVVSY